RRVGGPTARVRRRSPHHRGRPGRTRLLCRHRSLSQRCAARADHRTPGACAAARRAVAVAAHARPRTLHRKYFCEQTVTCAVLSRTRTRRSVHVLVPEARAVPTKCICVHAEDGYEYVYVSEKARARGCVDPLGGSLYSPPAAERAMRSISYFTAHIA